MGMTVVAVISTYPAQGQEPALKPGPQASPDSAEIVVTANRPGRVQGAIDQYSGTSIATLGAMTIDEVIMRLERRNGGPFSVIVNGRRLADMSDLRDVPPEALEEIQILANSRAGTMALRLKTRC